MKEARREGPYSDRRSHAQDVLARQMIEMAKDVRRFTIDGEKNPFESEQPLFHPKTNKFFYYVKTGIESKVTELLKLDGLLALQHNAKNETPLIIAVQNQHVKIVKILLEYGANPLARDSNGNRAIDYALQVRNEEIARLLEDQDDKPPSDLLLQLFQQMKKK